MLEKLRKKAGLSQIEVASLLKIPNSTYHMYEAGKRKVPYLVAISISDFFNVDISEIFLPAYFTVSKTKDIIKSA